ncbi:MAG: hypothetical protein JRF36_12060 [Deltaproteobacteria bacterium]|jgi:hypothetical protein|nr:hypothetical protein [Deltaproteobacteria bacterium]MBW2468711.1 hypothetical protein [Deltaproteobacteria bacterium]MBW2486084.1 hypothetical protein [Deltaproteobacteria bacterium]MBW2516314.1 hypothetical protein [Deltaproteobacteria bacterium]
MKPIHFDPQTDLAPMAFDNQICQLALKIKRLGIKWQPHVGCFVWDPDRTIAADSPFPHRIYFILSLPRFIDIFGSRQAIVERLVWLPTWHQARLLCRQLNVPDDAVANIWQSRASLSAGEELPKMYELIIDALQKGQG